MHARLECCRLETYIKPVWDYCIQSYNGTRVAHGTVAIIIYSDTFFFFFFNLSLSCLFDILKCGFIVATDGYTDHNESILAYNGNAFVCDLPVAVNPNHFFSKHLLKYTLCRCCLACPWWKFYMTISEM